MLGLGCYQDTLLCYQVRVQPRLPLGFKPVTSVFTQLDGQQLFTTQRLICRRWRSSDVDAVYRVYADPEGARWVDDGQPITVGESERWLAVTDANYAARGYGMFALEAVDTSTLVGFCGLVHPAGQSVAETKYAFDRSCWGKGYATEALVGLIAYAVEQHGKERVIATVAPQNLGSQRVLVKAGFNFESARLEDDGESTLIYGWMK